MIPSAAAKPALTGRNGVPRLWRTETWTGSATAEAESLATGDGRRIGPAAGE